MLHSCQDGHRTESLSVTFMISRYLSLHTQQDAFAQSKNFYDTCNCKYLIGFYFGVLHPVVRTLSRLLEEPPLATTI
jgi:hypothetical protein